MLRGGPGVGQHGREAGSRNLGQSGALGHRVRQSTPGLERPAIVRGTAVDGSWFDVDTARGNDGEYAVRQGGPLRLWDTIEAAHATWQRLGRPEPPQFTVVADVDVDLQYIRHQADDVELRWPLPL